MTCESVAKYRDNTMTATNRGNFISEAQLDVLVSFMENNPILRRRTAAKHRYLTGVEIGYHRERLWRKLAQQMNSVPGVKKDILKWKKTWADLKHKSCLKSVKISNETGKKHKSNLSLTSYEERVIKLLRSTKDDDDSLPENVEFPISNEDEPNDQPVSFLYLQAPDNAESSQSSKRKRNLLAPETNEQVTLTDSREQKFVKRNSIRCPIYSNIKKSQSHCDETFDDDNFKRNLNGTPPIVNESVRAIISTQEETNSMLSDIQKVLQNLADAQNATAVANNRIADSLLAIANALLSNRQS